MYSYRPPSTAMGATEVIRPNSGTQPQGHRGRVSGSSPLSSAGSTGSHRNKKLLKSYHDFTMQLFSSGQGSGENDSLFVAAVRSGDYDRVENILQRRSHEVVNIDARDRETGNTALMWAVLTRHVKLIRLLLKYGADVTLRNAATETVLDLTEDPQIRKLLLDSVLRKGVSPRHLLQAAWQGNVLVVRQLLNESQLLDINCRNAEGFTPLLLVTRDVELFESIGSALESYKPLAVIEELLRRRADPIATDRESHTALHYVSSGNSQLSDELAIRLMQIPLLANSRDGRSVAPIHVASKSGSLDVVIALLDHGVDVNTRGYAGSTPLHVSSQAGQIQVANTLLNHGADITIVDDSGNTAVDLAKTKRMKSVLRDAWMEITDSKHAEVLSPVKPPSRMEDRSPRQTRVHSLTSSTSPPHDGLGKRMMQKFADAHKTLQEEEQMLKDIEAGRFTPGLHTRTLSLLRLPSRNSPLPSSTNRTPAPPKTPRVLDPLSSPASKTKHSEGQGSKKPRRSLTFSGRVNSASKEQRSKGHNRLGKTKSDPTGQQLSGDGSQIPVTVVGLDLDDSLRDVRFQRILPPGVRQPDRHSSTQSDSSLSRPRGGPSTQHRSSDPSISDVAKVYQTFCNKDISTSPALAHTPSIRTSQLLNLEQMHLRLTTPSPNPEASSLYPTSRSILPLSPGNFGDNRQLQETIFEFEDENGEDEGEKDGKNEMQSLRLSLEDEVDEEESRGQQGVLQNRSVMFNIEASRVNPLKDSSDSGQGSSRSTVSHTSSAASLVMSSPSPQLELDRKEVAKNRLGIKMTPSATNVLDERIALFQRAKMRLPSLGRASPAVNQSQAHRSKRQTSEECLSVLSMSSISAVMSSEAVDSNDTAKEDGQRKSSTIGDDLDKNLQGSQNSSNRQGGKRKISLEDNSMLLGTRKQSASSPDDHPVGASQSSTSSPFSGGNVTTAVGKDNELLSRDNTAEKTSKRNTALVTPLCATKGKVTPTSHSTKSLPHQKTAPNFTCKKAQLSGNTVKKMADKTLKAQPPVPGTQRGVQEEKNSTLVGVSKPVIRTLEVLPVAKVESKSSGRNSEKDTRKVDNRESSKIDESVVKTEVKVGTPIEKSCTSSGTKKVKVETKSVIASKGKNATLTSKGRKEKKASDLVKLAPNLANKKACVKTDKQTVTSKPQREPDVKPEGKCAISVRKGAATAVDTVGSKTKNDQGKAKTGKKDAEEKKVITWRISCDDDDDSSESDFDNEDQRFVEEMPVTARDCKGQKEGRKGSTVPPCTKTDDFEELVESSDAEEVFEEVVFSDEEDTPTDLGKARTKQIKDPSKASSKHQKTSVPQGTKVVLEKSSAKPRTVKKPTPGAQQQKSVDRESVKGKGTFVKKPVKEDAHESGNSKVASKGVPVKKIMTREPRPTNETNPKKVGEKSNLTISNRKPSNGSTSETEVTKVKPSVSSNVTALKQKPAEGLRNSKSEGKELDSNEKAMPKAASKQLHLKNAASPAKVENSSQNINEENKLGATEKRTVVSIDSSKKDIVISAGNIGIGTMLANYTQEVSPKVLDESSKVNPAGQDYIDPAVKLVTSEQSEDIHLNPTSPREPKPGNNSFRKGKYKSPDTSPRDMAGPKVIGTEKKTVRDPMAAKQSPVIMDIVEMFKQATSGTSPDVKIEVLGKIKDRVASVKGPVKKLVRNVPKKVSGTLLAKGSKGKAKDRVGSGGKSKGRVGSGGSRGGEGSKVSKKTKKSSVRTKSKKKMKDINYSLVPESEQNTTAFITGQGWSIKTSRNENDDVYIQEGNQDDSSDEDVGNLGEVQLSPHNSLKLDELVVLRSISLEEKKNLVNILSPLEMNAPFFIPDTMGTIKEFADSLKSTSSSEMSAAKSVLRENPSSSQGQDNVAVDGNAGSGERSGTHAEPDQMDLDQAKERDPPVPDVRVRKSSSQMGDDLNHPDQDSRSLGLTGELSSYETNPDLLKVFRIRDHYETPSSQGSRRTSMTSMTSDEEQVREHLSLILNKPDSGSDANEEASPGQRSQLKVNVLKKKPPLPKLLQQHQIQSSKRSSPRRASEPNFPPADADSASSPGTPVNKSAQKREENKSQVSTIKNSLPDKKFSPPSSSVKKRRGKSLGDAQSEPPVLDNRPSPSRPGIPTKSPIFEVDGHQDSADDDFVEEEEPLTRHVQTLTEKTLQEFKTIAQSLDSTTTSVIHTRPPSSVGGQSVHTARSSVRSMSPSAGDVINVQGGDQDEREFLNQSIALSETSSEVFRDFNDTGESVLNSHDTSSSMISSTDRSLSTNTTVSESEGTELLHWKKGNLLGKGAFGTVYCGLTNTGQLLAVKQVELSEIDKEKAKQQYLKLQEEVQLLKTLRHKNIVGFLGVSLEDNVVNIFMQFIPGGSIASLLARFGSLDETVFCRYTKQILEGTQYLHENNVIHRDIKGANIMLMSTGVIKLIDFGCAKRLCIQISRSQNVLKSMRGTPYWMAPEVIMETGHGKKSDIWSIGCTVFEMATRKPPWADMPPMAAIFAIGSGDPVPQLPVKFSEDARMFVNACLTRDQDERATASELLKHPFIKRRKERGREHYHQTRISSTSLEDGPIVFREQPISRDSAESKGRKNYAPHEFR
ncbi:uncharacterized protein LOC583722 isoform X2 [Strongylocentrotus purpuratus]|uniref:Mitogen-activated protein kinase kinase kinase 19 n=1 Tax=Strongylocentrotus purpuratus TaxID=7668 RepID=A0A7M7PEK2_STRPU|nr:uncharacterized protein LOC583722 isoform X1 [Strongylocentrotus purpuratus]XP_030849173.1 uncharacterized protein LOC583722 isoform X2 [Strongylocentrotus purpuratus]